MIGPGHELPFNRRRRRRQIEQAKTVVVHLFAGKEDPRSKNEEGNGTVGGLFGHLGRMWTLLHNQHLAGWLEDLAKRGKVRLLGCPWSAHAELFSALRNDRDGKSTGDERKTPRKISTINLDVQSSKTMWMETTILWLRSPMVDVAF